MQLLTDTEGKEYWKISKDEFAYINKVLYEAAKKQVGWSIDDANRYFFELSFIDGEYGNKVRGLHGKSWYTIPRTNCQQKIIKHLPQKAKDAFEKLYRKNFRIATLLSKLYDKKLISVENGNIELSDELSKRTLLTLYNSMPTDDIKAKNNSWTLIDILFNFKYPCKAMTSHLGYSKRFLKKYGNGKLVSWNLN